MAALKAVPPFTREQSREGFRTLLDRMQAYAPLQACYVLLEHTGHYHKLLEQYLQEQDIAVYIIHVQKRPTGMLKSDKRDALNLANSLYSQLELGVQMADRLQLVRRALPPSEAASQLRGLIRHRYELIQESTQRKNKLRALSDELFPELTLICKDPNLPTALAIRERFPTAHAVATASLTALSQVRAGHYPSDGKLVELQELARHSIGIKDANRQRGLVFEQTQLIKELRLIGEHLEQLEAEIAQIVEHCREGKILTSIPAIGPIQAATILASLGNSSNFASAASLKSYFGWAPTRSQTGSSFDRSQLTHGGTRPVKQMMYLIVWNATRMQCEWARLYERLVPLKCAYDERTHGYKGKGKVMGRIAGQMITMIYALLKTDAETLSHLALGAKPPEPMLYDPQAHKDHRNGHYHALKPRKPKQILIEQVSKSPSPAS
jgi:transposase